MPTQLSSSKGFFSPHAPTNILQNTRVSSIVGTRFHEGTIARMSRCAHQGKIGAQAQQSQSWLYLDVADDDQLLIVGCSDLPQVLRDFERKLRHVDRVERGNSGMHQAMKEDEGNLSGLSRRTVRQAGKVHHQDVVLTTAAGR